jgi:sortase A
MRRFLLQVAALCVVCWGVGQMARASYIHSKASLAQILIQRAWTKTSKRGASAKPWPWADTRPVARLGAPDYRVDLMVLEGGSGRTLAFGPGHVTGTAMPGDHGNAVIGGHRDTHFRFLRDLKLGDLLLVETEERELVDYEVTSMKVVDEGRNDLLRDYGDDRLTLITCYPFDAITPGGPLRYVVTATATARSAAARGVPQWHTASSVPPPSLEKSGPGSAAFVIAPSSLTPRAIGSTARNRRDRSRTVVSSRRARLWVPLP